MIEKHYKGNPNLKAENVQIEFTTDQIQEYLKCKNDPIYFAKNYVKIVSLDEGIIPFKMWDFQEKLITNFHENRFNIAKLPRQTGKMLSLDTPIPTPTGWTTMGDLKIGDLIFGKDGKPTKVIGKSPIQKIDTYEIEFDNGETIKSCSKHLWKVSHSDWNHKEKVLETKDIIEKFNFLKNTKKASSIYVNICDAIELPEISLPIDPYTLGVWLGDGSRNNGAITGLCEDIEKISSRIPLEITTKSKEKNTKNVWRYYYKNLRKETHSLGLDKEKIIPEKYLRSSTHQRLELLRGLMDTDGSVSPNGSCEFYQKDGKLLYQVRELLSSLGIKSRLRYKKISGYDGLYGTISFSTSTYEVFTLPRKLERQKNSLNHPKNKRLYIKNIRRIETEPMQCISVDNKDHLFLCGKTFIPTHNSTTVVSYLLHYALFNDNIRIAILANKAETARELLGRLQLSYENLPKWLQQGVGSWNKGSLELENGSKIVAASTSSSAVRGNSFNIIFLDEFAFIPNHIAEQFFSSVYPTISSGNTTKVIIISTPNGMNMFYKLWHDAEREKNGYIPLEVHWSQVPGRDAEWKRQTIANTSERQFTQEFECEFLGSVDTLITPSKLRMMVYDDPLTRSKGLDVYEEPQEKHTYLMTVDVSRGMSNDYSAFIVFDISQFPYKVVAKYRSNEMKPMLFPNIIHDVAKAYNKAFVLTEVNDIGEQVSSILHFDLEYDNILMCSMRGRAGQLVGQGFSGKKTQLGIKMSKTVKKVGCSNLKTIIEDDKLLIKDYDIISELTTFIQKNQSFEAEEGCNDDLAMCLVIFAWLVVQDYFKEMTDNDVRKRIYEEQKEQIEQDMAPFGFMSNGLEDEASFVDINGDRWHLDEYGDRSYMWEYR